MTTSTPSVFPTPADPGRTADPSSFPRSTRSGAADRPFDDYYDGAHGARRREPRSPGDATKREEAVEPPRDDSTGKPERREVPVGESSSSGSEALDKPKENPAGSGHGDKGAADDSKEEPTGRTEGQDEAAEPAASVLSVSVSAVPVSAAAVPAAVSVPAVVGEAAVAVGAPAKAATDQNGTGVRIVPESGAPARGAANPSPAGGTPATAVQQQGGARAHASDARPPDERPAASEQARPERPPGQRAAAKGAPAAATEAETGKVFREHFAARTGIRDAGEASTAAKDFLAVGRQRLAGIQSSHGTDTATSAESMRSALKTVPQSLAARPSQHSAGGEASAEGGNFFSWKGWTHGGGEQGSLAARLSHATGALSGAAPAAADGSSQPSGTTGSTAPASNAPAVAEPKVALAEIGATIERLIVQGREQLSVTIRFQQGGTLSLQLGMSNGEVAARIQTDVAGLDHALRSGWGELAQDWSGRGIKLSAPVITNSGNGQGQGEPQQNGSSPRDGQPKEHEFTGARDERGAYDRGLNSRRHHRGGHGQAGQGAKASPPTSENSQSVRVSRGLKTWA